MKSANLDTNLVCTLEELGRGECLNYLATATVGRVAGPYAAASWPLIDLGPGENTWLAGLLASIEPEGVHVTSEVRPVAAGPALVDIAAALNAALVVVGSVGHGAIVGALLGSVSEYCVHHAVCPVVVVPPQERALKALHADRTPAVAAAKHP